MPSFDAVSEVDGHELTNAVDQANRVLATRFDFKGVDAKVTEEDGELVIHSEAEFQIHQIRDLLTEAMAKRGIDVACLKVGEVVQSGGRARQHLQVRRGIDQACLKRMVKLVRDSKLKVQAQVRGDQLRVSGKKRDDLQQVIAMFKDAKLELPLQFKNFSD